MTTLPEHGVVEFHGRCLSRAIDSWKNCSSLADTEKEVLIRFVRVELISILHTDHWDEMFSHAAHSASYSITMAESNELDTSKSIRNNQSDLQREKEAESHETIDLFPSD